MPLLVYRPRNYDQTHEREQYRNLCVLLKERYFTSPDEMCIFIGNFNIGDVELDGIIIKDEGVAVVEFKDYGGKITAVENGDWVSEEGGQRSVIKGGSGRKNPYLQAKINRNACRPILSETGALTQKQVNRLASLIVFHRSATIDNRISPHVKWLRVCDEQSFIDELDLIVSSDCDLEKDDFDRIIDRLALNPEWLDVRYSNPEVLNSVIEDSVDEESEEDDPAPSDDTGMNIFDEIEAATAIEKVEPVEMTSAPASTLPAWIESFLFDSLKARYEPDWRRFSDNLDLSDEDQRKYLGTYFPRSFVELNTIFGNLYNSGRFQSVYSNLDTIAILDICSGGGGDLLGTITACLQNSKRLKTLLITVIEACESSINSLRYFIQGCRKQYPYVTIECKCIRCRILSVNDILAQPINEYFPYDIILFDKAGSELFRQGMKTVYKDICSVLAPMLNLSGVLCMLDITMKDEGTGIFYPQILNDQVNRFIAEDGAFSTILPLSCRFKERVCNTPCYTQQVFSVSHRGRSNDVSKVAYRLLGHRVFVDDITRHISPDGNSYVVSAVNSDTCKQCQGQNVVNAFELTQNK
jgi:hypothetical protein